MKVKILIRTPIGEASKAEKKIKPLILGIRRKKTKHVTKVSPENDMIIWDVEGDVKSILKIRRNVARFDITLKTIFENKKVGSALKKLSEEDRKQLKEMFDNHTSVEVIQQATAEEIVESNKSFWQKIREKFN